MTGEGGILNVAVPRNKGEVIKGHPVFAKGAVEDYSGFRYEQIPPFESDIAIDVLPTRHYLRETLSETERPDAPRRVPAFDSNRSRVRLV